MDPVGDMEAWGELEEEGLPPLAPPPSPLLLPLGRDVSVDVVEG